MSSLSRTTPSLYRSTTMRQNSGHRDLYSNEDHSTIVLPPEIAEDPFQLQKWNVFCFFDCAFGLAPHYDDRTGTDFHIIINRFQLDGTRSIADEELIQNLEALNAQLRLEKRMWHPDRRRTAAGFDLNVNDGGERGEAAKAVWGAILEASRACEACLNRVLGRR
ncbi:hypothetical protein VTN00DRAFT_4673 [Thermoascus crustaceus]|uniref:uncharacterized protein n=1 Tax=Thermoascus crustaceus TaxID=5088 RepID=UPI003743087E